MNDNDARARLFVGLRISLEVIARLADAVNALRNQASAGGLAVRWVAPASYHITLKFIGWARRAAIPAVRDALEVALASERGFSARCAGVGAFPAPTRARVLWAGLQDPGGRCAALAAKIDTALQPLGFPRETRTFHGHVTLGRCRVPGDVGALLEPLSERDFGSSPVDQVCLYESTTTATGSEYTVLTEWLLGGSVRR
jgi:2'-5' RNA ligase